MKILLIFLSLFLFFPFVTELNGQRDQEYCERLHKRLEKKTEKDTTVYYYEKSFCKFKYNYQLDSVIYYLDLLHKRDPNFLSRMYAVHQSSQKFLGKSTFYLDKIDDPKIDKYLNAELIGQYIIKIESDDSESTQDEFTTKISELDQAYRGKIMQIDLAIKEKNKNPNDEEYLSLIAKHEELLALQNTNDSIAIELFTNKFNNEPSYFNKIFNSDEKVTLFTFLLHWGENLIGTNDMLQKLVEKNVLGKDQCKTIISRCYCLRYNKSPFTSPHCDQDKALLTLTKEEFPFFYELYQAENGE